MTWVKVCGVTQTEHVVAAQEAGADAVGIVLVDGSPRAVSAEQAAALAAACDVTSVLLTVDLAPADVLALAARTGVTGIQPYGRHAEDVAVRAAAGGFLVLYPVTPAEIGELGPLPAGVTPLVDHRTSDRLGGTGVVLDWSRLKTESRDYVLAGGLNPGNVGDAIGATRAWGVDASSGLESAPGVKDVGLIEAFVQEAKRA